MEKIKRGRALAAKAPEDWKQTQLESRESLLRATPPTKRPLAAVVHPLSGTNDPAAVGRYRFWPPRIAVHGNSPREPVEKRRGRQLSYYTQKARTPAGVSQHPSTYPPGALAIRTTFHTLYAGEKKNSPAEAPTRLTQAAG